MGGVIQANDHIIGALQFREALITWGQQHFRPFPWRLTEEPYRILMAEAMLHRTRAPQVVPVYTCFIERYPSLTELAQATKEDLHDMLYSLGLRWRIDLIYEMVVELMKRYGEHVPQDKAALLSLPGVSEYIAGALRCFAWNLTEPLIDTNTVRVVGRLFGLEIKDSSRRNRRFRELIGALVDPDEPRAYNYSLLDLADQVCMKKRQPECSRCPVQMHCRYGIVAMVDPGTSHRKQGVEVK